MDSAIELLTSRLVMPSLGSIVPQEIVRSLAVLPLKPNRLLTSTPIMSKRRSMSRQSSTLVLLQASKKHGRPPILTNILHHFSKHYFVPRFQIAFFPCSQWRELTTRGSKLIYLYRTAESREHRATGHYPEAGSTISKAQSEADKAANFDAAAKEIYAKLEQDPSSITSADAAHLESREARAAGRNRPSDSIAAKAKSIAAANEGATNEPVAKEHAFEEAVNIIAPKMAHEPEHITDEDANLLHSADRRAHGTVEKGGITAQAQHLAAENKGATRSQTS